MNINFNKLKRELIPFGIVYLLFTVIVVGSLTLAMANVPDGLNSFERLSNIMNSFVANVVGFKFFAGIFSDFFGFMQLSFWSLIGFVILFIVWKVKSQKNHEFEGEEHGSSDWCKNGEEFQKDEVGNERLNKKDGFILSKKHFLGTDLRKVKLNKNILVYGGSGTGKSACYIKPNILQQLGSYVITDPKGELYRETSGYLKANGYKVKTLNLVNPEFSDRYNPLAHIQGHADVDIIAHTIVKGNKADGGSSDPFWDNTAVMLLKACIYYVISILPKEEQNLSSCLNIVRLGGADETIFDKLFVDELKPEHPGRKEYEGIRLGADKTKQSIAISLVSKLTHFDSPTIQRITTSNDIEFLDLGNSKTVIYVITPVEHSAYDYILTIFFSQLLQALYADANKRGGTLQNQVYLLLDEFANIGQIPDFNKILSTTRSLGISVSIIIQSLDQIEGLYKDTYENIIGNCDTQILLGSQSLKTCEYFSKSLGQKTIKYKTKSVSKGKDEKDKQGVSISEQKQGRELMTVDEIKRMSFDDEIILVRGLKPIKAKKMWYFKYHPKKDEAGQYEISDITMMPKSKDKPIMIFDIYDHIAKRKEEAKKYMSENENSNASEGSSSNVKVFEPKDEVEEKFDLKKELEKKFDELFGEN